MKPKPRAEAMPDVPVPLWETADGRIRLFCAAQEVFLANLADASVDCIWTDPPYFLSNGGTTCVAGRRRKVDKGGWDRSRGLEVDHAYNVRWLRECQRVLKPAGTLWVSGTLHVYLSVGMAMQELGFRILNDIVWEKPNPPPNLGCRCFTHSTEILLWATKAPKGSHHRHVFNYEDMKRANGDRQMKNVWRFTAPGPEEKLAGRHPTQKPLGLVERCLAASTRPGDLVIDPFSGSGTTALACARLARRFAGCEIEPRYARLAAKRLESATRADGPP
ncbi:MAG: site-specific DNA-methyltransferase [Gammaproteobacteria bacterium]